LQGAHHQDDSLSKIADGNNRVTRGKLITPMLSGACATVVGVMLLTYPFAPAVSQPPTKRCVAISNGEYDGAKRDKLLRVRFGVYVKTGWFWSHSYWYCRY
jgi:hypothetical protein